MTTYRLIPQKQNRNDEYIFFDIEDGAGLSGTFYVTRSKNVLNLYPEKDWETLRGRILDGDQKDPKTKDGIVNIVAPAVKVQIDHGALLLPREILMFDNLSEDDVQLSYQCSVK